MIDKVCAKRYAQAFLESLRSAEEVEAAVADMLSVRQIIGEGELKGFFSSAGISIAEKCQALKTIFAAAVTKDTLAFLLFVVEKGRAESLCDIAASCQEILRHTQHSDALVKSTVPLQQHELNRIKAHLEKKLHKKLDLKTEIDPRIIGGIQVVIDSVVIDGSVKRRFDELRDKLSAVRVN